MREQEPFDGHKISKLNRRSNLESERGKERHHPYKRVEHVLDRNTLERRAHLRERKALKRK